MKVFFVVCALLCWLALGDSTFEETPLDHKLSRVAILGGGIGGSSAAYFLKELLQDQVEIFVFERSDRVGGRLSDVTVEGVRLEIGKLVYVACR